MPRKEVLLTNNQKEKRRDQHKDHFVDATLSTQEISDEIWGNIPSAPPFKKRKFDQFTPPQPSFLSSSSFFFH